MDHDPRDDQVFGLHQYLQHLLQTTVPSSEMSGQAVCAANNFCSPEPHQQRTEHYGGQAG